MYTKDDTANSPTPSPLPPPDDHWRSERSGRVFAGFLIVAVGSLLLARQSGADIPRWLFDWPLILIAVGLFIGVRHRFRGPGWILLVGVGSFFMADHFIEDFSFRQFIWPIVIITVGILMIVKPKRKHHDAWRKKWKQRHHDKWTERWDQKFQNMDIADTDDDRIDTVAIFGSVKKNIISKDFKGGEATCVFGGAEINLGQADINGRADLELTQIFGGAKLIVPADWKIQTNELVCIMGGFEDKRKNLSPTPAPNKILVIRGTCVFGGIEIKSY